MLVFDIETDGFLDGCEVIHCINVIDRTTSKRLAFNDGVYADGSPAPRDGSIEDGLATLAEADCIAGHNIIGYDIPAIRKLRPSWSPRGRIVDTQVIAAVIYTNLMDLDMTASARGRLPEEFRKRGLMGTNKLEAWGYRLGEFKGEFDPANYTNPETNEPHTWKTIGFTPDMDTYGRQDPEVTLRLLEKLESKAYAPECLDLEHRVKQIIFRQQERGFAFSVEKAEVLVAKLQRRYAELEGELQRSFEPWYAPDIKKGTAVFTPKGDNKAHGYTKGCPLSKVKHVVFNPASRDHIADRLMKLRGWKPTTFTDGGKPQVDETILEALPWPEAKLAAEYLLVEKRLGQVANGKQAWLGHAVKTGLYGRVTDGVVRIHGGVQTNGAVTGRMSHIAPNVAQTPTVGSPYGKECRECWIATPGLVLVGCDAEGIELRMLGHYMARWDGGAYVQAVVNGKKEDGTDVHTVNQKAIGLNKRDAAKTFIYALIYGAGDFKLGTIVYDDFTEEQKAKFKAAHNTSRARSGAMKKLGTKRRAALMAALPALGELTKAVKAAAKARGFLKGLDGRLLHVRAEHSALNTLLQSGGAVVMKKALVLFDERVTETYRCNSVVVEPVANIHDEFQIETEQEHADQVGLLAAECIKRAGEHFGLRCPLSGSYSVGGDWASTH